jgi:hypothetical protein
LFSLLCFCRFCFLLNRWASCKLRHTLVHRWSSSLDLCLHLCCPIGRILRFRVGSHAFGWVNKSHSLGRFSNWIL